MIGEPNIGMGSIFDGLDMQGVSIGSADWKDLMDVVENDDLMEPNTAEPAAPTEPRQPSPFPLRIKPPAPAHQATNESLMPVLIYEHLLPS